MIYPLPWVRKIDSALQELDRIPLYGSAPRFDIHRVSSLIASHLSAPSLSIEIEDALWRTSSEVEVGLGPHPLSLGVALSPLSGKALWLMPHQDVVHLTSWLLRGHTSADSISSEILAEGFYRYLVLNALDAIAPLEPLKQFTLSLDEEASLEREDSYCIDIRMSYEQRSCWGRLVISAHLLSSWQRHFASLRELFSVSPLAKSIEVEACLRTGSVLLSADEWKSLKEGDFMMLDRGSYDPRKKTGIASLTLGATPLFHVSVKENKIKLLDYALFYEENMEKRDTGSEEIRTEDLIPSEEGRAMAVKELPLFITVELARLRMTVDQLMKLSPGNFLELPVHPDQGVALTVGGQKVGRGELIYLGEKLGLRILETAES